MRCHRSSETLATIIPVGLVLAVSDMSGLADMYAVGVVGAIATNLGATSTDRKMVLTRWERGLMFFTFFVMAGIEISLLIDKPGARYFAVTILAVGLIIRELAKERVARKQQRTEAADPAVRPAGQGSANRSTSDALDFDADSAPTLAAFRGKDRTLDFALKEGGQAGANLVPALRARTKSRHR